MNSSRVVWVMHSSHVSFQRGLLGGRVAAIFTRILDSLMDTGDVRLERRLARGKKVAQMTGKPGALVFRLHVQFEAGRVRRHVVAGRTTHPFVAVVQKLMLA